MSGSLVARVFLGMNAAFSLAAGLVLLFFPDSASHVLFVEAGAWKPLVSRALGAGLVLFALVLTVLSANRLIRKSDVILVSVADLGWVLGSAFLLFGFGDMFTPSGVLVIDVVAVFVAAFAIGQFAGARRMVAPLSRVSVTKKNGVLSFHVGRKVNASASHVWTVMTDHPGYADVASNISKVEVVSGEGVGMQRRCYGPKAENWLETCNHFEEGRAFGFRVHTEAPDYPYPIAELTAVWTVVPADTGSEFSIRIEAMPSGGFLARALFGLVAGAKFKAVLIDLAEAWAERMETPSQALGDRSGDIPAHDLSAAG